MPRRLHGFLQPEMVGEDTTERTTVSLTTVDLSTITMPRVAVTRWISVRGAYRKSAGAAAAVSLGLKVNATQVFANTVASGAGNEAGQGVFEFMIPPQEANYLQAGVAWTIFHNGTTAPAEYFPDPDTNAPAVAVTSIVVTGLSGSASVTLAIKNVQVYVL